MLMGSRDRNLLPIGMCLTVNPSRGDSSMTTDKLPDEQRFLQMIQHLQKPDTDMNIARHEILVMLMVLYRMARGAR
jgi:hypothetical protein